MLEQRGAASCAEDQQAVSGASTMHSPSMVEGQKVFVAGVTMLNLRHKYVHQTFKL